MGGPSYSMQSMAVSEFVGTFLLVLTVGCNVLSGNAVWAGVSIACVLMVAIYAFGPVSGGNFNPAVSLAITQSGKMGGGWRQFGIYTAVQIAGGLAAAVVYYSLFGKTFNLGPAKGFGPLEAAACELLYTFMLCFVVLNVACNQKSGPGPNQFFGLAIGFVIVAGAYGAGAISGGCFNPAVAIAIGVSSGSHVRDIVVYVLAEFAGAALAHVLFKVCRPREFMPESNQPVVHSMGSKLVSEFIGTYILVLTVGLNVLAKSPAGAFSIAASLMCMIYALGDVSGANFNPAVTVALLVANQPGAEMPAPVAGQYIGAQLAGGIAAGLTYSGIYGWKSFGLGVSAGFGWLDLAIAETVFTFVLCFIVLSCAVHRVTKNSNMFGFCIGMCVTVGGFAIGGISGGSLNPAVSFGIALSDRGTSQITRAIAYSVFELLGGVAAAGLLKVTHTPINDIPK